MTENCSYVFFHFSYIFHWFRRISRSMLRKLKPCLRALPMRTSLFCMDFTNRPQLVTWTQVSSFLFPTSYKLSNHTIQSFLFLSLINHGVPSSCCRSSWYLQHERQSQMGRLEVLWRYSISRLCIILDIYIFGTDNLPFVHLQEKARM